GDGSVRLLREQRVPPGAKLGRREPLVELGDRIERELSPLRRPPPPSRHARILWRELEDHRATSGHRAVTRATLDDDSAVTELGESCPHEMAVAGHPRCREDLRSRS